MDITGIQKKFINKNIQVNVLAGDILRTLRLFSGWGGKVHQSITDVHNMLCTSLTVNYDEPNANYTHTRLSGGRGIEILNALVKAERDFVPCAHGVYTLVVNDLSRLIVSCESIAIDRDENRSAVHTYIANFFDKMEIDVARLPEQDDELVSYTLQQGRAMSARELCTFEDILFLMVASAKSVPPSFKPMYAPVDDVHTWLLTIEGEHEHNFYTMAKDEQDVARMSMTFMDLVRKINPLVVYDCWTGVSNFTLCPERIVFRRVGEC